MAAISACIFCTRLDTRQIILPFWIPEIETCLAVDAVEHPIPEVWSSAPDDLRSLCSSLNLIRSLKPKQLVLAHGQTSDPAVLDRNIAYFENIQEAVALLPASALEHEALHEREGMSWKTSSIFQRVCLWKQ